MSTSEEGIDESVVGPGPRGMKKSELLAILRTQKWAVACTACDGGVPESALVGIAVTDALEIIFDTSRHSRKVANLERNSGISFVIGGWVDGDEQTVQFEGHADLPQGEVLRSLKEVYFAVFPEGRERDAKPETVYVRATPRWVRYSSFNQLPPVVQEFNFAAGGIPSGRGVA